MEICGRSQRYCVISSEPQNCVLVDLDKHPYFSSIKRFLEEYNMSFSMAPNVFSSYCHLTNRYNEQSTELGSRVSSVVSVIRRRSGVPGLYLVLEAGYPNFLYDFLSHCQQTISLNVMDEDSYEKDVLFYVELGEVKMLDEEAGLAAIAERKRPEDRTEEDKMALLGRPRLGDITRAQIRLKESKEFKNTVDKLVQRANASILIGTSSWKEQFVEAITVSADDGGDDEEEKLPSCGDYIMHFVTLFWKILFAFVPPTDLFDGYLCFVTSICGIGCLTAVIGDVASHFGCTVGLKDTVTAVAFVALGTSVPDTFASKVAAIQDKYADASVGNVTGSNAVNVFLGIGVAWSLAAIYHAVKGNKFYVEPG
ncbi:hypothetical protein Cfor_09815, partial [Coptotermes formosanus]